MDNACRTLLVTFALALAAERASAASPVEPDPVAPRAMTSPDPSVAKAVAEAAATLPQSVPGSPSESKPGPLDALGAMPRKCSSLESAAKVALVAACVRLNCSPAPTSAPPPTCYLFKGNIRG